MHIYGTISIGGLQGRQRTLKGTNINIIFNEPSKLEYILKWKAKSVALSHYKELFNIDKIEEQLYTEVERSSHMMTREGFKASIQSYVFQLHANKQYLLLAPTTLTYTDTDGVPNVRVADTILLEGSALPLTQYERGVLYGLAWLYAEVWDRLSTLFHELLAAARYGRQPLSTLLTTLQSELQSQYIHESKIEEKVKILYRVAIINYLNKELGDMLESLNQVSTKLSNLAELQTQWTKLLSEIRNKLSEVARKAMLYGKIGGSGDSDWYYAGVVRDFIDTTGIRVEVMDVNSYKQSDAQSRIKFILGPSTESIYGSLLSYAITSSDNEKLKEFISDENIRKQLVNILRKVFSILGTLTLTSRDCNTTISLMIEALPNHRVEVGLEAAAKVVMALIDVANLISELARLPNNIRPVVNGNAIYTNLMPERIITKSDVIQVTYPLIMTLHAEHGLRATYSVPGLLGMSQRGELEAVISTETILITNREITSPSELVLPVEVHEVPGMITEISIRSMEIMPGIPDYLREYKVYLPKTFSEELQRIRVYLTQIFENYRHQVDVRALSDLLNTYLDLARIIIRRLETNNNGEIDGQALMSSLLLGVAIPTQGVPGIRYVYKSDKILGILTLNLIAKRYRATIAQNLTIHNMNPETDTIKIAEYNENHGKIMLRAEAYTLKDVKERSNLDNEYINHVPILPNGPRSVYLEAIAADTNPEEVRQLIEEIHMNIEGVVNDIVRRSQFKVEYPTTDLGMLIIPVEQSINTTLQSLRSASRYHAAISSIVNDYLNVIDRSGDITVTNDIETTKILGLYTNGSGGGIHDQLVMRLAPAFRYAIGTARKIDNLTINLPIAKDCAGILVDRNGMDLSRVQYIVTPVNPMRIPVPKSIIDQVQFPAGICLVVDAAHNITKPEEIKEYYQRITTVGGGQTDTNMGQEKASTTKSEKESTTQPTQQNQSESSNSSNSTTSNQQ
ncbi:MAG: hypothetical protein [aquatic viral metagenome]